MADLVYGPDREEEDYYKEKSKCSGEYPTLHKSGKRLGKWIYCSVHGIWSVKFEGKKISLCDKCYKLFKKNIMFKSLNPDDYKEAER
ncbi:hypothetical protein LCGC14_2126270 [marine sediment metagenome]|uniref:Uncharacterized protein n=1 Tax=marine sediment metagenome TaxID=412755 RepID=A0A0F9E2U8_9ZZZZ